MSGTSTSFLLPVLIHTALHFITRVVNRKAGTQAASRPPAPD
jgi:hypothetical protein